MSYFNYSKSLFSVFKERSKKAAESVNTPLSIHWFWSQGEVIHCTPLLPDTKGLQSVAEEKPLVGPASMCNELLVEL